MLYNDLGTWYGGTTPPGSPVGQDDDDGNSIMAETQDEFNASFDTPDDEQEPEFTEVSNPPAATPTMDRGGVETGLFVRRPSWGGGGTKVEESPKTSAEALKIAGLDWLVTKEPVWRSTKGGYRQIQDKFVIVRDSDESELGVVGKNYEPFQNYEAFDFLDGLAQTGEIEYETAGSLYGGKRIWVMCKMPDTLEIAGGDIVQPYMFVSTSHDGSAAITAATTGVRIECANTFTTAHSGAKSKYTFRHTSKSGVKLQEARETLKLQIKWDEAFKRDMDTLVQTSVDDEAFSKILQANFPDQKVQTPKSIAQVLENRRVSETIQDEYRPTAYGALNALTEWSEHMRAYRNAEARTKAVLVGWASTMTSNVTRDLLEFAK